MSSVRPKTRRGARIAAVLTSAGLAVAGLCAAAPAAQADESCTITAIEPTSVTIGLRAKEVTFTTDSTCDSIQSWTLDGDNFYVYDGNDSEIFNPSWMWNADAGYQDVIAEACDENWDCEQEVLYNGFQIRRQSTISSFNAGPEPVRMSKQITIKGKIKAANWDTMTYTGLGKRAVKVQFRTPAGSYRTIKTVKTSSTGWVNTTTTARSSGYWRLVYDGTSTTSPTKTTGDYVRVR